MTNKKIDKRRTNFSKIADATTGEPAWGLNGFSAVISFGGKEFFSSSTYSNKDSARRQSRKIIQALRRAA